MADQQQPKKKKQKKDKKQKFPRLEGNPMPGTHPSALQSPFSHVKTTSL